MVHHKPLKIANFMQNIFSTDGLITDYQLLITGNYSFALSFRV